METDVPHGGCLKPNGLTAFSKTLDAKGKFDTGL